MIGRTLDHYRIESRLGEGGMGVVYKAWDTILQRPVAIKVLPPDSLADAGRTERFLREARAASALNHPNIVTIHDIRSDGETDFIIMEYVEGQTLADTISGKALRPLTVLRYAVQMAEGLAVAHAAGIFHRDLKPSNVMFTGEGRVKIVDFGLAKLSESTRPSPDAVTVPQHLLTEEGAIIGTAAYMSPEQAEGRPVDARTDIFSFGTVLYEMLTGRLPFAGSSRFSILSKIVNDDPIAPHELISIPADLEKVVLRCLRKDPARRFQSMADLKVALEDLQLESTLPRVSTREAGKSRRRWIYAALLPLSAALAFVVWWMWLRETRTEPLRAEPLTTFAGVERYPSLSPDGKHVAFTWNGPKQDNDDVYVQMIGAGTPLRLTTDPLRDINPVWSPDGQWIAFLRFHSSAPMAHNKGELRLIAPLGGPERVVTEIHARHLAENPAFLTWCPDGTCLIVTDSPGPGKSDALFLVSRESGAKRQLTRPAPPALTDNSPAMSPDGRSLMFRRLVSWSSGDLHQLALRDGVRANGEPSPRRALSEFNPDHPVWTPDGREILFSARGALWRVAARGDVPPERLPFVGEDGLMATLSRPDGKKAVRLAYARSFRDENIWRVDLSSAPVVPRPAIRSTRSDIHAQFSPDGRRVAFTSTRSGNWEIWLADGDGGNAVQLTSLRANATGAPSWSPDGSRIVFASDRERQFDLYSIPAAGGTPHRITSDPSFEHDPTFSRDGKWLYFCSDRSGAYEIWKMPASGGKAIRITHNGGWASMEAPDGSSLYYTQTGILNGALWRVPATGGDAVHVLDGISWWSFVVVKAGIYYCRQEGEATSLQFFDFSTQHSTTVVSEIGEIQFTMSASPDGRMLLYSKLDSSVDDLVLVENFR